MNDELVDYATYLVWLEEVDTGLLEHPAAEALIGGYMDLLPATAAVAAMWRCPRLFGLYRTWALACVTAGGVV
jgi:hypothetical protein